MCFQSAQLRVLDLVRVQSSVAFGGSIAGGGTGQSTTGIMSSSSSSSSSSGGCCFASILPLHPKTHVTVKKQN
jgi:hypothetical protein